MAKRKKDGMAFRELLKAKPKNLPVQQCRSQNSPTCLRTFIQSRYEQTMCYACLVHNDLLSSHPLLHSIYPEDDLTDDDSFVNQLW